MHTNSFSPKTLNGNWFEQRCESNFDSKYQHQNPLLSNPAASRFQTTQRGYGSLKPQSVRPQEVLRQQHGPPKQKKFMESSQNWLQFQPAFDGTFKTTQRQCFKEPKDQKSSFAIKETALTRDKAALNQYHDKWTKAGHNFNRLYVGTFKYKKAYPDQDE